MSGGGGVTCDTSVLVPALMAWHPEHGSCRAAVLREVESIPAHVVLECYSVLTRLPAPHRVSAQDAGAALGGLHLRALTLPASRYAGIVAELAAGGIRGGSVYDALVAATAQHHGRRLLTRDRRARSTYDAVGVGYALLG